MVVGWLVGLYCFLEELKTVKDLLYGVESGFWVLKRKKLNNQSWYDCGPWAVDSRPMKNTLWSDMSVVDGIE